MDASAHPGCVHPVAVEASREIRVPGQTEYLFIASVIAMKGLLTLCFVFFLLLFVCFFSSPLWFFKLMTVLHEESFLFLIEDWLCLFCDNFRNILGWFLLFASYKYCALSADD